MNLIQIYVKDDATNFQEIVPYVGAYGEGHIRVRLITQFTGETSWFAKFKKPNALKSTQLLMIDTGLTEQVEVSPGVFENWKTFERTVDGNVFDIDSAVSQNVKGSFDYWFVSSDGLGIVVLSTDLFNVFPSALVSEYARVADTATDWVYQDVVNATTILTGNSIKITTVGTTDYTLIGAPNNNVGTVFVATGVPTGTGTAEVWVDSEVELAEDVTREPTELYDIPVDPNFEAQSSQPLTNEEVIIDTLNGKLSKQEAIDNYINQDVSIYPEQTTVKATDLIPINDGDTGNIKYAKVSEIVSDVGSDFTDITLDSADYNKTGAGGKNSWSDTEQAIETIINANVTLQNGRELLKLGRNSGAPIPDLEPVAIIGSVGQTGQVEPVDITDATQSFKTIGMMTEPVGTNETKNLATIGRVRGDFSAFAEGAELFCAVGGGLTATKPTPPNRCIRMGTLERTGVTGIFYLNPIILPNLGELSDVEIATPVVGDALMLESDNVYRNTLLKNLFADKQLQNGQFRESFDFVYNIVTHVYDLKKKTDDPTYGTAPNELTMQFSDGETTLNLPVSIAPTFGIATAPTGSCIYILQSTKTIATASTFPATEHIKVAELSLLDQTETDADGDGVKNQNYNNHASGTDNMGALQHIRSKLRDFGISFVSGIAGTGTGSEWVDDVAGTLYFKSSAGVIKQLHEQVYQVQDTSGSDDMHVVNESTTPYNRITTFNEITEYSDGTAIGNQYFNVVVFGIGNKTGTYSPLFITVPTGGYSIEDNALNDIDNKTVLALDSQFKKVSFPIIRATLRKQAAVYSLIATEDLRATTATLIGSGGGTFDGEIIDTNLKIQSSGDVTKILQLSALGISTSTTRTLTAQDKDYVIADDADRISDKAKEVKRVSIPTKDGVLKNSPKLVVAGASNDAIKLVQHNGSKYVMYDFDTANGDTGIGSVGTIWDLIRIKKATLVGGAYVAKNEINGAKTVGTVGTLIAASLRNTLENYLVRVLAEESTSEYYSSTGDGFGIALNSLSNTSAISSVTYDLKIGSSRKANVLVYGSSGSSDSVDILVNNEIVKSFDPRALSFGVGNHYRVIEFDIPTRVDVSDTVEVTLRNNNVANKVFYFGCMNFMFLKDYDGRDIDFYKVFGTDSYWINASGSSDYAIYDKDLALFVGSFHGGETRITARMTWYPSTFDPATQWNEGRFNLVDKSSVSAGWVVLPNFELFQVTDINGKGKMLSKFNFNTDGTIDMSFSFYDGTITVEDFYTGLTSTEIGLDWVKYPRYEALPAPTTKYYLQENEGFIQQTNPTKNLTLGIRYSRFEKQYLSTLRQNGWIDNDAVNFKKFYYGFADNYTDGVLVENLTFRKALDFIYE